MHSRIRYKNAKMALKLGTKARIFSKSPLRVCPRWNKAQLNNPSSIEFTNFVRIYPCLSRKIEANQIKCPKVDWKL